MCFRTHGKNCKGRKTMTENEEKLIDLIRNSKDPEKALITAVNIIVDFLKNSKNVDNPSEV